MPVDDVAGFAREFQRKLAGLAREHAQQADRHKASAARAFDDNDDERGYYHVGCGETLDAVSYRFAALIKEVEPLASPAPPGRAPSGR